MFTTASTPEPADMDRTSCFRAHTPEWASTPTSGAGAAIAGGRWNRSGQEALYLSFDPLTAVKESNQQVQDFIPITLVRYQVSGGKIGDYRDESFRARFGLRDDLVETAWWGPDFEHTPAPSQKAAADLIEKGFDGLIYPSSQAAGINLVLWRWNEQGGTTVAVEDTHGVLPRDRSSWRR
ncbi:RES family NAD+ phosphorylase [Croceicoccus sp. F390]|uniref:RES family NAD+ phosphorylase n=1 Tax=Croceicoccus esteveae TaxID=3075597 RepID=A0ABU2ZIG6_9SPHN|nr:RES family NAD+ phosphorylase [Croceicoccus sp. F390]MDT0576397.1 RES family NAD+ phosphorylase [Croceicoccus sp. F390]